MADIPTTTNETSSEIASVSGPVESSSKIEQVTEIAMNLLMQGRRYLLVSDIPSAIAALAESVQLLVKQYGEYADECAESYYYYGMALLEKARTDCDVLDEPFIFTISLPTGDKVEGEDEKSEDEGNGDDEEESEEKEDVDKKSTNGDAEINGKTEKPDDSEVKEKTKVADDEKSTTETAESKPETASEAASVAKVADVETKESEPSSEHTNRQNSESKAEGKTDAAQIEEKSVSKPKNEAKGKSLKAAGSSSGDKFDSVADDEEVPTLLLAWEVFEKATHIYQRKAETDPAVLPKLVDALIGMAEVALESENYTFAIEDLQKCLKIQKASFPADSRSLAETHYKLGVAFTFTTKFKDAVRSFESAAGVIQHRIDNLTNPTISNPSMEEPKNMFYTVEGEIEELESLLPDIRDKIADIIDLEEEAIRNGRMETDVAVSSGESSNSEEPATDIPHSTRKKREPDNNAGTEPSVVKKICRDHASV